MSDVKEKAAAGTAAQFNDEDGEISQSSCAYSTIMHDGKQSASDSDVNPPSANRGVRRTCASEGGLRVGDVVVDWLSFTLPCETWLEVLDALAWVSGVLGELVDSPRGFQGYEHSAFVLSTGRVGWSKERPENGVHVSLGSQALGLLARQDEAVRGDVRGFIRFVLDSDVEVRRLDLALDDRRGLLVADTIIDKVQAGELTTAWRSAHVDRDLMGDGVTIYLGSRRSDAYARVYDKRAERISKGNEDPGPWIRAELELKRERAQLAARMLVRRGVAVVPAILRGQVEFREPTGDSNKSRWPVSKWWLRFLGYVERQVLSLPQEAKTLERVEKWIKEQVAPSLSSVFEWRGGELGYLLAMLSNGEQRRPPWQRAALEAALEGALGGAS